MTWTVASDIAERIRNLREALGRGGEDPLLQSELARRAGVRASQVSQWERGAQRPSRSRLERWAEREGWPVEMFQEGRPMPSEILLRPASARASSARDEALPDGEDPRQILGRFYEVMAHESREGRPCPPELAVLMQSMYALAAKPSEGASTEERRSRRDSDAGSGDTDVPPW